VSKGAVSDYMKRAAGVTWDIARALVEARFPSPAVSGPPAGRLCSARAAPGERDRAGLRSGARAGAGASNSGQLKAFSTAATARSAGKIPPQSGDRLQLPRPRTPRRSMPQTIFGRLDVDTLPSPSPRAALRSRHRLSARVRGSVFIWGGRDWRATIKLSGS